MYAAVSDAVLVGKTSPGSFDVLYPDLDPPNAFGLEELACRSQFLEIVSSLRWEFFGWKVTGIDLQDGFALTGAVVVADSPVAAAPASCKSM